MQFSHLCNSVILYPIETKFATKVPARQGSPHSTFQESRSSHFRDMSDQSFGIFFLVFFPLLFAHFTNLL